MKKVFLSLLFCAAASTGLSQDVFTPGHVAYVDSWMKQAPRLFIPSDYDEVVLWVDAQDVETVTATPGVNNWADKTVYGNDLSQLDALGQPEFTGTINGYPAVDFVNAVAEVDFMETAGSIWTTGNITDFVMFMVFKSDAGAEQGTMFHMGIGPNAPDRFLAHVPWNNGNIIFDAGGQSSPPTRLISDPNTILQGESYVMTLETSVANSRQLVAIDGTILAEDSDAAIIADGAKFSLGGFNFNGSNQDATIGEVIVWNGAITVELRQTFEGYLAWKWGMQAKLPLTHPFKNLGP